MVCELILTLTNEAEILDKTPFTVYTRYCTRVRMSQGQPEKLLLKMAIS